MSTLVRLLWVVAVLAAVAAFVSAYAAIWVGSTELGQNLANTAVLSMAVALVSGLGALWLKK